MICNIIKALTFVLILSCATAWGGGPRGTIVDLTFADGTSTGFVDYEEGYIQVTKTASPNMALVNNPVQAESQALKTATNLARTEIAQAVGGVQIDSKTLIEMDQIVMDAIRTETSFFLKNTILVSGKVEWIPNRLNPGTQIPMATATVRLYLGGEQGFMAAVNKRMAISSFEPPQVSETQPQVKNKKPDQVEQLSAFSEMSSNATSSVTSHEPQSAKPMEKTGDKALVVVEMPKMVDAGHHSAKPGYGYLIIDSSKVNPPYRPALHVYLKDENGKVVYSPNFARTSIVREGGRLVRYAKSIEDAKRLFATSGQPLIITATRVGGPGEVFLSTGDALIVNESNTTAQFLKEAKVVLVME